MFKYIFKKKRLINLEDFSYNKTIKNWFFKTISFITYGFIYFKFFVFVHVVNNNDISPNVTINSIVCGIRNTEPKVYNFVGYNNSTYLVLAKKHQNIKIFQKNILIDGSSITNNQKIENTNIIFKFTPETYLDILSINDFLLINTNFKNGLKYTSLNTNNKLQPLTLSISKKGILKI